MYYYYYYYFGFHLGTFKPSFLTVHSSKMQELSSEMQL